ncbi:MAG: DUF721 domain-containing protein [Clostridium sp.]|nr:DUF721 domain-containing protein [Clostridium sp.]
MEKREPKRLEQIIREAIADGEMNDNFDAQRASAMWPDIVGRDIASRTTRRYVDGTVLHVFISSAPLKNELGYYRRRLVELLNQSVGRPVLTDLVIH